MTRNLDREIEAIAAGQLSLFHRRQAEEAGAKRAAIRHRVATGRWSWHRRDVLTLVGAPVTHERDVLSAILQAGNGAVASHATAAVLWGLPGFEPDGVELTVVGRSAPDVTGATLHRARLLPEHHCATVGPVPCTTVARTIFDLCGTLHPRRAERAMDNALARRLVTIAALEGVTDELLRHGRAGSALTRRLLEARGSGYIAPESELEARFIELLRSHGLPEPERQVDLGDADGWIGRVDFYYPDVGLVIEVDGRLGHRALLDRQHDAERDRRLRRAGHTVLRFTWQDVTSGSSWVARAVSDARAA